MLAKYLVIAAAGALLAGMPNVVYAQGAGGGDVARKCRALVRQKIPNPRAAENKRQAGLLYQSCVAAGGKL